MTYPFVSASVFAVHEAVIFTLNPLKSSGSIAPETVELSGAVGTLVVSTSAFSGVTGPAETLVIFKSSHLSLLLTRTHLGA